jgi:hypothetical protein
MVRPVVSNSSYSSVPISDIHRRDGSDASRVDKAVRGDAVDFAARNADVL